MLQAPLPDVYRGKYRDPETAGQLYAEEVKKLIDQAHSKGKKVLCMCSVGVTVASCRLAGTPAFVGLCGISAVYGELTLNMAKML